MAKKPNGAPMWPADRAERRAIGSLRPFERNSRLHSPEQVEQVANSIKEFGWTNAVLINADGDIIAGHARVLAAQSLGLDTVPCIVATGWTDAQRRAYLILDNKLALNASWDDALLRLEIDDLKELGVDAGLIGFNDGDLAQLFLDRADGDTDAQGEWNDGMPGFNQQAENALQVVVHFKTEADRAAFGTLIGQTIPNGQRASIFWPTPKGPNADLAGQQWVTDADGQRTAVPALHPE